MAAGRTETMARKQKTPARRDSTLKEPDEHLWQALTGDDGDGSLATSRTGGTVSLSAVFAAIRLLGSVFASLPLKGYRNEANGNAKRDDTPEIELLRVRPNPTQSAFTFWEGMIREYFWNGNAFAEIERTKSGRVVAFHLITQSTVEVRKLKSGLRYVVRDKRGRVGQPIDQADMLHIPFIPDDGIVGDGIKWRARRSLEIALSAEISAGAGFENDQTPGGVLKTPTKLTKDARQTLRTEWAEMHKGPSRSRRPAVLQEGLEWQTIARTPVEAQVLESRQFSVYEIARWFNLPPHMLRELTHATFSNIEHQGIDFAKYTMAPICVDFAQELQYKLFGLGSNRSLGWDLNGLMRGDLKSRYDGYGVGRQNGFLSTNDIRGWENLPLIEGPDGDALLVNGSMKSIEAARLAKPGDFANGNNNRPA